jgi:hypothetical protein
VVKNSGTLAEVLSGMTGHLTSFVDDEKKKDVLSGGAGGVLDWTGSPLHWTVEA